MQTNFNKNLHFLKIYGIIIIVAWKNSNKRRVYIILTRKSKIKIFTKKSAKVIGLIIIGFILIIAIMATKYRPIYEVSLNGKFLGYVSNTSNFKKMIEDEIVNQKEVNVDNISLIDEPQYELKLLSRKVETNEHDIIATLKENDTVTTYKFYAVVLNEKSEAYVDTVEEAEEVVDKIKSDYDGNDLELDLTISEIYTENKDDVKTDNVKKAENTISDGVEELIEAKEAEKAIATVNGVNLSVLPVSGTISSRFSDISSIRSYRPHTGLDIACSQGTSIKVVAKGKVIFSGWDNTGLGNCVKIDHGNGIQTWYGHCSKLFVSKGDEVSASDVIAAVGSTGNSTGPHLHFEIRINGKAVNPQIYVYNK